MFHGVNDEKGGSITITREINQEKPSAFYSSYMNRKYKQKTFKSFKPEDENKQVVYFTKTIPLPIYVLATYEITLKTNYIQQMNELCAPIITFPRWNKLFCRRSRRTSFRSFCQARHGSKQYCFRSSETKKEYLKLK